MNVLALDTTLGACSVAVAVDGRVVAADCRPLRRGHAEALAPMIARALDEAGLAAARLERIGVTVGPGTFTGQRVGLAMAHGMGLANQTPLVGITTLEALAASARAAAPPALVAAAIDVRRGDYYYQCFDDGAPSVEESPEPRIGPLDRVIEALNEVRAKAPDRPLLLAGSGAPALIAAVDWPGEAPLPGPTYPEAADFIDLIARRPPADGLPGPLYLRPPDARLPDTPAP